MDKDQYLQMIENQLKDALDEVQDAEKKFNEATAKFNAINKMKNDYLKWVVEK